MLSNARNILLIVNPAAQNGRAAEAAQRAAQLLEEAVGPVLQVANTKQPRHAEQLAREAKSDVVIALGGDGIISEVANGLYSREAGDRPTLGIIPVGSGNDYARSVGMSTKVETACSQLLSATPGSVDVGLVNDRCFVETLSFGVDAAIALDTVERRKRTGRSGATLYMASGFDQLVHHLEERPYRMTCDDGLEESGVSITFAVQVGPYYGGGFRICPKARFDDGVLDICIAHPPIGVVGALGVFLMAKAGRHTGFPMIDIRTARNLHLGFDQAPPAQMDGEAIVDTSFDIGIAPAALRVLLPLRS